MDLSHVTLDLMNRVAELERIIRAHEEQISYLLTEVNNRKDAEESE